MLEVVPSAEYIIILSHVQGNCILFHFLSKFLYCLPVHYL